MKQSERGIVALMATVILSLLLIIITVSLVTLEVAQLRKAEDSEQSLRAYYAAEAGVEDAVNQVLAGSITPTTTAVTNSDCIGTSLGVSYDSTGSAGWTCQRVSYSGTPEGKLPNPDEARTVDTFGAPRYDRIVLQWNQISNVTNPAYFDATSAGLVGGPGFAPPIEVSMLQYPKNTTYSASDICVGGAVTGCTVLLKNILIVPAGGSGIRAVSFNTTTGNGPWQSRCLPGSLNFSVGPQNFSGYNCAAIITDFDANSDHLFRLRSRYGGSSFKMTFLDGNNIVDVPDGMATIDVTAKAGDTYRRVVSKLPLTKLASSKLNFVIYSDTDICKNYAVIDEVKQNGCF